MLRRGSLAFFRMSFVLLKQFSQPSLIFLGYPRYWNYRCVPSWQAPEAERGSCTLGGVHRLMGDSQHRDTETQVAFVDRAD